MSLVNSVMTSGILAKNRLIIDEFKNLIYPYLLGRKPEESMNSYDWLLNYLICPLFTSKCSYKLEPVSGELQCGCGAVYGIHPGTLQLRPIDNRKTASQDPDGKYQEQMFVNMFVLRQYGSWVRTDIAAPDYRQTLDIRGGAENFYQTLLAVIHPYVSGVDMIADVGCGTGRLAGELGKISRQAKVIGFDYSPAMVSRAAQIIQSPQGEDVVFPIRTSKLHSVSAFIEGWGLDNCAFIVADGQFLPLQKSVADVVTCTNVFHRVASPATLLSSISRILKPGGVFLVSNSYDWKEEFTPRERWFDCFDSLINPSEWRKLAEVDGIIYVTPTYNRKFDLAVNHVEVFKKIG